MAQDSAIFSEPTNHDKFLVDLTPVRFEEATQATKVLDDNSSRACVQPRCLVQLPINVCRSFLVVANLRACVGAHAQSHVCVCVSAHKSGVHKLEDVCPPDCAIERPPATIAIPIMLPAADTQERTSRGVSDARLKQQHLLRCSHQIITQVPSRRCLSKRCTAEAGKFEVSAAKELRGYLWNSLHFHLNLAVEFPQKFLWE